MAGHQSRQVPVLYAGLNPYKTISPLFNLCLLPPTNYPSLSNFSNKGQLISQSCIHEDISIIIHTVQVIANKVCWFAPDNVANIFVDAISVLELNINFSVHCVYCGVNGLSLESDMIP